MRRTVTIDSNRPGRLTALVRSCRLRQWTKNLLVFAVPAAAGGLDQPTVLGNTAVAFAAFCLASSGTYLLNDARDVESDRRHPTKRFRPVAAGHISVTTARAVGLIVLAASIALSLVVSPALSAVVVGYVGLTFAYTYYLKHVPVFDIAVVSSCFFLRAVAGGVASHIFVSRWFLIIAGAGSLFLVSGKRYAELKAAGDLAHRTRPVLAQYTTDYLQALLSTAAAVTVIAYCLWAFEGSARQHPSGWTAASAVPFVLGIMRYGLLLEHGHGEEPEHVLRGDPVLMAIGGIWFLILGLGLSG